MYLKILEPTNENGCKPGLWYFRPGGTKVMKKLNLCLNSIHKMIEWLLVRRTTCTVSWEVTNA